MQSLIRILYFVFLFFFLAGSAHAGPFLVSDPHPNEAVDRYQIDVNGVIEAASWEYVGSLTRIKHDVGNWSDGPYTVKARAGNVWKWGPWSDPLIGAKAGVDIPVSGLGIEP